MHNCKIIDVKTNKPIDISYARVTYDNRTVLVTANTLITSANEDVLFDFKNAKVNGKPFKGGQLITVRFNDVRDIASNSLRNESLEYGKILLNRFNQPSKVTAKKRMAH